MQSTACKNFHIGVFLLFELDQIDILSAFQNAAGVFKQDKDLAGLMRASVASYASSQYVLNYDPKAAQEARRTVNFGDKWGRIELARLCAAALYADWTSTLDFVKGVGGPFWEMLTLLATRSIHFALYLLLLPFTFTSGIFITRICQGPNE